MIDVALDLDLRGEGLLQAMRQRGASRRLRAGRRDGDEFVATGARQEGALAGDREALGGLAQERVADVMTEHVVDRLEAVDVEREYGEAVARHRGQVDGSADAFVEGRAVGQIGERVVMRHVGDTLLVALAVGKIAHQQDLILRLAIRSAHEMARGRDDADAVAGGFHRVLVNEDGVAAP